ncbi:MAG: HEAT repeat domain-containing protein, partial [candidate division WOR-3 bacterium]
LSRLESETLIELIVNWERQRKAEHIVKVLGAIEKAKLKTVVPALKNRQSKIYQYLFHAGVNLLVEDMVASTVTEDDLHTVIRPYQGMLRADNDARRHDAYKSLLNFAIRLTRDSKHGMANGVLSTIMTTIEGETEGIIAEFMDDFGELYGMSDACGQRDLCENLIESFGRVLGRTELPISLRKRIIEFLSATQNPSVLPILFSLLWESGLYPDVRSAIIGFKSHAVKEAVQLLRYAEEFTLRMRLIDVLKNMGGESIEVLMENLGAREWFLRRNIVRIFGEIGEPSVCPRIEHMLDDEDHRVRLEVVRAFSRLKCKAGLLHSLNDGSLQVKGEALRGLRTMIDAEEFIDMLPRLGASGDEVYVQLLKIIDEKKILEAIHWIADLLRRIEWRSDEQATEIKELGVAALARMGGNEAKIILMDLQNSQDKVLADLVSSALKRLN